MKLFTKTVCPKCILIKRTLQSSSVEYTEVNIDHDEDAKNEVLNQGIMAAPVMLYKDKYISDIGEMNKLISDIKK